MKIDGNRPVSPSARRSKVKQSETSGFNVDSETPSARSATGLSGAQSLSSVDALLALQSEFEDRPASERASRRAFSLLDILDDIKLGLLEGGIPQRKLRSLVGALEQERAETGDSQLETLLDEVETRALVELAKHESALV